MSAALRLLSDVIPPLDDLGLPPAVLDFPRLQRGIILVMGESGSGKSTTMAALLDQINHTRTDHIITLEDPVEYVHTPDQCVINQREIGPTPPAMPMPCAPCCARTPTSSLSARCAT